MPANYVLLEKISVGAAGASSVTFSGIPQTGYTDLVLVASNRMTGSNPTVNLRFNSDTTQTNYYRRTLLSYGSGVSSNAVNDQGAGGYSTFAGYTASTFASTSYYIPNYTGSTQKSYSTDSVTENNSASDYYSGLLAGLWTGTAAITGITVYPADSTNWVSGSTFYLYGVAKLGTTPAIVPYATGGDTIMTDGTYWYHTFISSGTFTPQKALSCDYLVVAGGGGGGSSNNSGGGGAGGLRSTVTATGGGGSLESALSLGTSAYTVTIGAGGAGGVGTNVTGTNGSNSVFSTITSTGGGGGGGENSNGGNGGSSGGGGYNGNAGTRTASPVQGNNGANGSLISPYPGGGGGGAGAAGSGGSGGNGATVSITGSSVTYGGGGSGGRSSTALPGGTGGGGSGGQAAGATPTAGGANLGGGGGGGAQQNGASGGSGIVIVRYAV